MDYSEYSNIYDKYLKETSEYRKNYLDDIIEKYTNTDEDDDYIILIKTLKVVQNNGKEARIPGFGNLNSYSCEPAQQLIEERRNLIYKHHDTSKKKFLKCAQQSFTDLQITNVKIKGPDTSKRKFSECAQQSFTDLQITNVKIKDPDTSKRKFSECAQESSRHISIVENKYPDTSKLKIPICDLSLKKHVDEVSNKDLDVSQKKFSEYGKRTVTPITIRKNPAFKRNLNFLPSYKNFQVDDLSLSRSSFSKSLNGNNYEELDSADEPGKDKYPVKSNCNSEISYTNLTAKSSTYYISKRSPCQTASEENVVCNSKTSYANNKMNFRNSILNSYTDLSLKKHVDEVSNKDLDVSQKKFSEYGKRTVTPITIRKNPAFKRNLNFLPSYKNFQVDDLSLSRSSFSKSLNGNNYEELDSVDEPGKDKYPVKSNCNSEISYTNLTAKSSTYYISKRSPCQTASEENVVCNSKTSYANNKMNFRNSILNSYTGNYKERDSVNKQRNDECPAIFHYKKLCIRSAKLRHPYYRKSQTHQNSFRYKYEEMDFMCMQKIDKYPTKNAFSTGLPIIKYTSKSNNNVHVKKLKNKRQTYLEKNLSEKNLKNFFSRHVKNYSQNIVYNDNILKVPHVILMRLEDTKYA